MPERLVRETTAPLPWSWTLPLELDTPERSLSPRARAPVGLAPMGPLALLSEPSEAPTPDIAPEPTVTAEKPATAGQSRAWRQRSAVQAEPTVTAAHHAFWEPLHPVLEMPDNLLLDAKSPFPWTWRMPLSCDSPLVSEARAAMSPSCPKQDIGDYDAESVEVQTLLQRLQSATGNTPRIMAIIREAEEVHKNDKHMLATVYSSALNLFGPVQCPQADEFHDLSVKCMRVLCQIDPDQARELHKLLSACSQGRADARIYEARAAMEEQLGHTREAVRVLQDGLAAGAQPPGMLRRLLMRLRPRASPQLPEAALVAEVNVQARGTPSKVPQYSICTPEHTAGPAGSPRWSGGASAVLEGGPVAAAGGTGGAEADGPALGPTSAGAQDLRRLFAELREELVLEVRSAQHTAFEQGFRLHAQLQGQLHQEIEVVRAEARQVQEQEGHCRRHKCPRCCREAVEGAVQAILGGVACAVGDALHDEAAAAPLCGEEAWRALADEVWEHISAVRPPEGSGMQGSDTWPLARLAGLVPLRDLLSRHAAGVAGAATQSGPATTARPPLVELPAHSGGAVDARPRARRASAAAAACGGAVAGGLAQKENAGFWLLQRGSSKSELRKLPASPQSPARLHSFLR